MIHTVFITVKSASLCDQIILEHMNSTVLKIVTSKRACKDVLAIVMPLALQDERGELLHPRAPVAQFAQDSVELTRQNLISK